MSQPPSQGSRGFPREAKAAGAHPKPDCFVGGNTEHNDHPRGWGGARVWGQYRDTPMPLGVLACVCEQ